MLSLVLIMELISGLISFSVGYYALKGYKASSAKGLLLLYFGFVTLGISIFLRVITISYVVALRASEAKLSLLTAIIRFAGLVYTFTQIVSYLLFTISYAWQARLTEKTGGLTSLALFPLIYISFFNPYLELVIIVLLGYVTTQAFMNMLFRKNSDAFLVFLGFTFMLLGHLFLLFMIVDEILILFGQLMQLIGFLCLLAMLAKVSKGK